MMMAGVRTTHPEELGVRRFFRLYSRAVRLRCPACGGGPLLQSWFRMRPNCPSCGIRTERGEQDFVLGAMMFNIILSEGLLAASAILFGILTWPDVPWDFLYYATIALMVIAPFIFVPFSRAIWLASDILIRPLTAEELEWHRSSDADAFRPIEVR
jgi:uncharacterized protein (DUF983 family)